MQHLANAGLPHCTSLLIDADVYCLNVFKHSIQQDSNCPGIFSMQRLPWIVWQLVTKKLEVLMDIKTWCAVTLADLKKTLAVLLDNIMLRLGKLEAKVENIYNGTGGNLTNSTVTATPIATNSEKVNVAGGFVINLDCVVFCLLWQGRICPRVWIGKPWREWLSFMVPGKRKVGQIQNSSFFQRVFFRTGNCTGAIKWLWPTKETNDKIIGTVFLSRNSQIVVEGGTFPTELWQQCTEHTRHFMGPDHILGHHSNKASTEVAWPLLVFTDLSAISQMMYSGLLKELRCPASTPTPLRPPHPTCWILRLAVSCYLYSI